MPEKLTEVNEHHVAEDWKRLAVLILKSDDWESLHWIVSSVIGLECKRLFFSGKQCALRTLIVLEIMNKSPRSLKRRLGAFPFRNSYRSLTKDVSQCITMHWNFVGCPVWSIAFSDNLVFIIFYFLDCAMCKFFTVESIISSKMSIDIKIVRLKSQEMVVIDIWIRYK